MLQAVEAIAIRQVPVEPNLSGRLAGPGCPAHFIRDVSREGKANRKQRCCSTAFSLTLSISAHSLAPSGTAPDRKWTGREVSRRGGGASWPNNLLEVKKALTQESVLAEGAVSHTASEAFVA